MKLITVKDAHKTVKEVVDAILNRKDDKGKKRVVAEG